MTGQPLLAAPIVDFLLLWSFGLNIIKWSFKNYISHEAAGFLYMGGAAVVAIFAQLRSNILRRQLNTPKLFASLRCSLSAAPTVTSTWLSE
jgi:hypothetical protein